MKKALLILLINSFTCFTFAQNNWYWFNPFHFLPDGQRLMVSKDTSGKIFFFGPGSVNWTNDYIDIVDQAGFRRDTNNGILYDIAYHNFLIDSRNEAWCIRTHHAGVTSGIFRNVNGQWTELGRLWDAYDYGLQVVDDHHQKNYLLGKYYDYFSKVDTFVVVKFDGSVQQKIDITHLVKPYPDSLDFVVQEPRLICDYNGALYMVSDTNGLAKYENENWSFYPINDSLSAPLLVDYHNNVYFKMGSTNKLIVRFDGNKFDSINLPACIANNTCKAYEYIMGPDSSVWMLADTNAFYKLNTNKTWTHIPAPGFGSYRRLDLYSTPSTSRFSAFDNAGRLWVVSDDPYLFGWPDRYVGVYSLQGFDTISGKIYWDTNENQIQDNGERGFKDIIVSQTPNNFVANSRDDGAYECITLRDTGDYTISIPYLPKYFHLTTPSNMVVNPTISPSCCYNFGLAPNGNIVDLEVDVTSERARPGFEVYQWITYRNSGTVSISDTISFVLDSAFTFLDASPVPAYVTGRTVKWAFTNLFPFGSKSIGLKLKLDSLTTLGDTLYSVCYNHTIAPDSTPTNNVYHARQIVFGSFDPNEKKVQPEAGIPSDELIYTIFFQNTGTDTAFKVVVRDTLSPNLNIASFRVISYSHPMEYTLKDAGNVEFRFSNILLPDSHTNEPLSHGFVKYAIKAKNNLISTAQITNTAYIYFDFNAPVVTNTTLNTITTPTGISPLSAGEGPEVRIFPNPATNQLFIQTQNFKPQTVSIYDMNGRKIMEEGFTPTLDISGLMSGVYFVELKSAGETLRNRFTVNH